MKTVVAIQEGEVKGGARERKEKAAATSRCFESLYVGKSREIDTFRLKDSEDPRKMPNERPSKLSSHS